MPKCCDKPDLDEIPEGYACINCGMITAALYHDEVDTPVANNYSFDNNYQNYALITQNASTSAKRMYQSNSDDTIAKRFYLKRVRTVAANCKLNPEMKKRAQHIFLQVFPKFKAKPVFFKVILSAVCVYQVMMEFHQIIPISDFCKKTVSCKVQKFLSIYVQVKKELKIMPDKAQSVEEEVRSIFMHSPDATQEDRMEYSKIVRKAVKILELADKVWLITGRSRYANIIACSFFAWQSMDPTRFRLKFEFFYKNYKFDKQKKHTAMLRKNELQNLLLKLAQHQFKSLESTTVVKKLYVSCYVDSVLSGLPDLLESYQNSKEIRDVDSSDSEGMERQNFFEFRKKKKKRVTFRDLSDSECEHIPTDEEVISESEWSKYICSERELKLKQNLRKLMAQNPPEEEEEQGNSVNVYTPDGNLLSDSDVDDPDVDDPDLSIDSD